ncbi:long-chain-fatty-acid--CoA ligase [Aeromicrobium ginsengisoli]|uniref:Long-chain fatty acid--CoA ligase n=1 Tax=Aeromicrobium ginsengisoli TaxID=363867 RepID=A0A5M4FEM6_9ACTN|nr:long-chain fatty acid--CoA ligase [Aeromicrobium ginsengisoli]KAA1397805.1 long-chain fatty acid--CoA ligase [Aeromicrobium ginsengisoli]
MAKDSNRNVSCLLSDSAARHPDRAAIIFGGSTLTYADVDAAANRVANLLVSRGIEPGDKVALSSPNVPYFTIIYFGILKAGATVVPLNILLKPREVAYHLADSEAKAYFAFEGSAELPIGEAGWLGFSETESCVDFFLVSAPQSTPTAMLGEQLSTGVAVDYAQAVADQSSTFETAAVDDEDTAVILYTSGTTGQPKGAELRHRNMRDNALAGPDMFGVDAAHPDTYLCVLPLFHSFGQTVIQNGALAFGGTIVMLPRFEAKAALDLMLTNRVTLFAGVPTMYWGLLGALDEGVDVATLAANLRVAIAGGSALPGEVHKNFKERVGVTILEGYGLSETSPVAAFSVFGEEPRVGSIGKPIPGVEMKLINDDWTDVPDNPNAVGEIAIKGHNVMKGYYQRPDATAEAIKDGWFRSGDLAKKDADGYYFIVDRSKDMIIRGGFNVYPRELEEVLLQHPAASLVAVIGVPNDQHGEEIKAVIVKNKDHDEVSEADVVAWGKEQFAAYKYPRVVEFVEELPMTSTGKILKRELS